MTLQSAAIDHQYNYVDASVCVFGCDCAYTPYTPVHVHRHIQIDVQTHVCSLAIADRTAKCISEIH